MMFDVAIARNTSMVSSTSKIHYDIKAIADEVRRLVLQGAIGRQQPIYTLCQYIPPRDWIGVEQELEMSGYLLRDRIGDLLGRERWDED